MRLAMLPLAFVAVTLPLAACKQKAVEATNEKPSEVAARVAAANAGGAPQFQPGRWETAIQIVKMDMDGVPPEAKTMMERMMGKGRTVTSCLTTEQAEKPGGKFFGQADQNCTYDHFSMNGGQIDAKMTCKTPHGAQVMTMNGTFTPASYESTMQMEGEGPTGQGMTMTMHLSAKRTGDCTGKEDG
ncbi:MAG: hypothetical protein RIS94_2546 [Pseudomonadota bacterium]|jgi:hypothetical protein